MDDLKVGEYVRTKNGKIDKVINNNYYISEYLECEKGIVDKENILKHSFNIIDLIELRDIIEINNEKYEVIFDKSMDKLGVLIPNRNYLEIRHSALEHIFEKYENITILTKEQYKQNCYTVERKKEC